MSFKKISQIGIVFKADSPEACELSAEIARWFEDRKIKTWQYEASPRDEIDRNNLEKTDLIYILGGDGTIVSAARHTMGENIPMVGVNLGRIGFLAELTRDNWQKASEKVLEKGIRHDTRMGLSFSVIRKNETILTGQAVNDVVITRGACARLLHLSLKVDGNPLMNLRSDGIIVSSPTGSSGYASSAGGSLLSPNLDAYHVAAICPFLNSFYPLVLEGDSVFDIKTDNSNVDVYLTLDGQENIVLEYGDIVRIKGKKKAFTFADMGVESYVDRLKRVGFTTD